MTHISAQIVREAKEWIGTPYLHQCSVKGAGTDCLGLIRGVWRKVYGQEPSVIPAYTSDWSEPSQDETLLRAAHEFLNPVVDVSVMNATESSVLVFRMNAKSVAKHLGILTRSGQAATFVHAYSGHGVVESPLSPPWARRVAGLFEFPERT